jgi:tRNA-modifying protein YgfZ
MSIDTGPSLGASIEPGAGAVPSAFKPSAALCRLDDWGLIRAQGEQTADFLHGQLTQDMQQLGPHDWRLAGYCSAKGRLLATLTVWRRSSDELLLACSADLLPATLKRLSMFVLRAKCKLTDASAELPLWGLAGDGVQAALGLTTALAQQQHRALDGGSLLRLADARLGLQTVPRYLWAGAQAPGLQAAGAAPASAAPFTPLSAEHWRWLEVHSGVPRLVQATSEQFVPQMVNLEMVGGVNFQKGCYPGQEVVARSQYRGTLKRRAFVLHGPLPLHPGQEIFHSQDPGQPAGMVVLSGTWAAAEHAALAELKIAALTAGTLHAGAADGPVLRLGSLPYPMPLAEPA